MPIVAPALSNHRTAASYRRLYQEFDPMAQETGIFSVRRPREVETSFTILRDNG